MVTRSTFTSVELLALASDTLLTHGFSRIEPGRVPWTLPISGLFEDAYSIVAVVVFETWQGLDAEWSNAQASMVRLISAYTRSGEAKAWEGYLVLLTPSVPSSHAEVDSIRYNVQRVRKLVATGYDLGSVQDVEAVLTPLLPLPKTEFRDEGTALDILPDILARRGLSPDAVRIVVEAFRRQEPLVEGLYKWKASAQ